MNTQKTNKGISFFVRAQSLETAQRVNHSKKEDCKKLSDEFIGPMWIDPEKRNIVVGDCHETGSKTVE